MDLSRRYFSSRKLIFCNQKARWVCGVAHWDEEEVTDWRTSFPGIKGDLSNMFSLPLPSLSGYLTLVSQYNIRKLSYPEDAVFAFSGITIALSRVFDGGFISGLPQMFFDVALLWQPMVTGKRRMPVRTSTTPPCLPSWSWVGWECDVYQMNCWPGFNYIKNSDYPSALVHGSGHICNFTSLLQWTVREYRVTEKTDCQHVAEVSYVLYG